MAEEVYVGIHRAVERVWRVWWWVAIALMALSIYKGPARADSDLQNQLTLAGVAEDCTYTREDGSRSPETGRRSG
jgi:hypothetical protein